MLLLSGQIIVISQGFRRAAFSNEAGMGTEVMAIGASKNDGHGNMSGHVRVYHWTGTSWQQRGNDIDGESIHDSSAASLSLSNDGLILAIGAPYNDAGGADKAGQVKIYEWNGSSWVQ
mgnify:CR=1 FL=1